MSSSSTSPKKKLRSRAKGFLRAAFMAAVVLAAAAGGAGCANMVGQLQNSPPPPSEPNLVQAFGNAAAWNSGLTFSNWDSMLQRQQASMDNPKDARQFNSYLATYNQYKGESLVQMADNVNDRVQSEIDYSDTQFPNDGIYWESPFQTEKTGEGNCKDYASLQYVILRHLGVPENRLFIAIINADGQTDGTNHAVLIENTAEAGKKQSFIVLNDGGPVINAKNYTKPGGANSDWPSPYVFYDALNQSGTWTVKSVSVPSGKSSSGQRPTPASLPGPRIG